MKKVREGLERCSKHDGSECPQCPYFNGECTDDLMADALALLKEQEEKPLRCYKCSYHREDGWCGMHGRWVKETDYCSLGAWKGR